MLAYDQADMLRLVFAAQAYEIKVEHVNSLTGWKKAPESYCGCDIVNRILFIEEKYSGTYNPAVVTLHELAHIVCAVPWIDGYDLGERGQQIIVPEQLFLMQYEDALAKACEIDLEVVDRYRRYADIAVPHSESSHTSYSRARKGFTLEKWYLLDEQLPAISGGPIGIKQRQTYWWGWGLEICKMVGLLNQNDQVTWNFPIWTSEVINTLTELSEQLEAIT